MIFSVEESIMLLSVNQKLELNNIIIEYLLAPSRNLKSYFLSFSKTEVQSGFTSWSMRRKNIEVQTFKYNNLHIMFIIVLLHFKNV